MSQVQNERHNLERGLILKYLLIAGPNGAAPGELRRYLKLMGRAITRETLEFHLRSYLQPRGLVALTEGSDDPEGPAELLLVHITPAGIDRVDQRNKGDDGISL